MAESNIEPFRISISDYRLQRLRQKLSLTDFPKELDNEIRWFRGVPLSEVQKLAEYWLQEFNWVKAEASLNSQLPQFKARIEVDGFGKYDVHFVHLKSKLVNAIPLLFLHGWPGSFIEVLKIAHPLTNGDGVNDPSFHVIAPSLIDHGFSSGSRVADFHIDQHAEAYHKLMLLLGYEEYVAQGGDTGWLLCRMLGKRYPDHCRAHHINMSIPREPSEAKHPEIFEMWQKQGKFEGLSHREKAELERARSFQKEGSGYFAIHTTRPLALAYSMADSPVGLLAWIYDKLHSWSDDYPWTRDEILTWVSIYYFSEPGPSSSFNTYYSNQHRLPLSAFDEAAEYVENPVGISRFSKEIINLPKLWNHTLGPVVFEAEHNKGGHFAAFEVPELLVQDLREMFGRNGGVYSVIEGANGFVQTKMSEAAEMQHSHQKGIKQSL